MRTRSQSRSVIAARQMPAVAMGMLSLVMLIGTLQTPRPAALRGIAQPQPAAKLEARATQADPNDGVTLRVLPAVLPMFTAPAVPPLAVSESND